MCKQYDVKVLWGVKSKRLQTLTVFPHLYYYVHITENCNIITNVFYQ